MLSITCIHNRALLLNIPGNLLALELSCCLFCYVDNMCELMGPLLVVRYNNCHYNWRTHFNTFYAKHILIANQTCIMIHEIENICHCSPVNQNCAICSSFTLFNKSRTTRQTSWNVCTRRSAADTGSVMHPCT